jgi:hypothetical protein
MIGAALTIIGAIGVIVFAFLSWRALGGSAQRPDANAVAQSAPPVYRWAGRIFALIFVVGVFRFFTT